MRVHLINPSDIAFGFSVITPRWLYVLAAATPAIYGDPRIVDETLERVQAESIHEGDIVGIGIHTSNALRGFEIGRLARARGAYVVFGGVHASLYPHEPLEYGAAHAVVTGDGDGIWATVVADCVNGNLRQIYEGSRLAGEQFSPARWELLHGKAYLWASVQTVRGCPKHCSFCSVWRTDGQTPRQPATDAVLRELLQLRQMGYRFILLADDNFYPVTLRDIEQAERQKNFPRANLLRAIRADRFELMRRLSNLPQDMVFFTQITMEAADDPDYLIAMREARIRGALVGVEAVTGEGLKSIFKDFNSSGEDLVTRLRNFKSHGIYVLGSFIFGLATDRAETFDATARLAKAAELAFSQFVILTPFPGTIDFERWEKRVGGAVEHVDGIPLTRYWLIPAEHRPKVVMPHPTMSSEEIRSRTQRVWDQYYRLSEIWARSRCVQSLRARLAFLLISKLYRQMYANTGIATDSARRKSAGRWARWIGQACRPLFRAKPIPELVVPAAAEAAPVQIKS